MANDSENSVDLCGDGIDYAGTAWKKSGLVISRLKQVCDFEPLNFIDVMSREQIARLITESCPTMIFVEHDENFVKAVATEIIDL